MNKFYFDKIIEVTLDVLDEKGQPDPKRTIHIKSTTSGIKPNIDFEISMLPDELCYDCTVQLHNFMYMDNIREYNEMKITAGYKYSDTSSTPQTTTFTIAIFSSWQESPNPDGITVFRGVTVGKVFNMLTEKPVTVTVTGETDVKTLIEGTAFGASGYIDKNDYISAKAQSNDASTLEVRSYIPDKYMNMKISLPRQLQAGNGIALLESLYETLYGFFQGLEKPVTYIQHVYNGVLVVGILEESKQLDISQRVVNITSVYTASFNAVVLNITAPWDPLAAPGTVVRISTNYFNGLNAPIGIDIRTPALLKGNLNYLTKEEINTGAGLYRILTCKVQFSTCGETNMMTLMMIPIRYSREQANEMAKMTYQAIVDTYKKGQSGSTNVVIGGAVKNPDTKEIFQAGIQGSFPSINSLNIPYGRTFSDIAKQYYGISSEDLYKLKDDYNKPIILNIKDDGTIETGMQPGLFYRGISVGRSNAWPLILAQTYKMQELVPSAGYKVDINDPDTLPPGAQVSIPMLPSDNAGALPLIAQNKNLFKAMGDYYIKNLNNKAKPWAKAEAIHQYNMYLLAGGSLSDIR